MWYLICGLLGYCLGLMISEWTHRASVSLRCAKGIKMYYHPTTEDIAKLEIFYMDDSFDEEALKKYKVFFDRER